MDFAETFSESFGREILFSQGRRSLSGSTSDSVNQIEGRGGRVELSDFFPRRRKH